jgi:hypothetical protein
MAIKKTLITRAVAQRGGDRSDKVTGPGATAGSRGAWEDQITHIKWGPGKAKSRAPEGPEKWYMAMTRLYSSCSYGQLMIRTRPYLSYRFGPKGRGRDPGKCNKAKLRKIQENRGLSGLQDS